MGTLQHFIQQATEDIETARFVKMSLGNYKGVDPELKNIYIRPVLIKRVIKLSFVYRYARKDITKNYDVKEGITLVKQLLGQENFRAATFHTVGEVVSGQLRKGGKWIMRTEQATSEKPVSLSHDQVKTRKLSTTSGGYLQDLKLADQNGKIYKNAQDKWKQINHYIDILSAGLAGVPVSDELKIVDMGSGKGYLTFALYDYLTNTLNRKVKMQGVEYRQDMVDLCNGIAARSGWEGLVFEQGGIENYVSAENLDILIALHACDTATDEAIFKGIQHQAQLIVTAPCCHKQVRKALESHKTSNDLDFMTRHGVFMERHAEMLTDSIRSLLLEYCGYRTKVIQFVSDAHTPKNVMIMATKGEVSQARKQELLQQFYSIKAYFGLSYHHLERLLAIN